MNSRFNRTARPALLTLLAACIAGTIPALAVESGPTTTPDTVCLIWTFEAADTGGGLAVLVEPAGGADPALAELIGLALLSDDSLGDASSWLVCETAPDAGAVTDLDTAVWSRIGPNTTTTAEP